MIPGYDPFETAGDCWLDEGAAQRAIDFFPTLLKFIEGKKAGRPFELEPWQQAINGNLYGWRRADGTRRYRQALVYIARKNGKTPWLAGLTIYEAFCGGEPGAQLYSAAADLGQAALIFRHASGMIAREPELANRCKVFRSFKSFEIQETNTIYKALTKEADTKHGLNVQFVGVDEVHAHPDRELVDVLNTGTASRSQPMTVYITTADYMRDSICNEIYDYACGVRDGMIDDPSFLPVIYEAGHDDDWTKEDTWRKANPNLGVSVNLDYLRTECEKAKKNPALENTFRRLHLNQRTEQDIRWLKLEVWDSCTGEFTEADLAGRRCFIGADLSSKRDLSALSRVFPPDDDCPRWRIKVDLFAPASGMWQDKHDTRTAYEGWAREGWLTLTPGNIIDYDFILARIEEYAKRNTIVSVGFDPWNATHAITTLAGRGYDVMEVRQGYVTMSDPMKEMEALLAGRRLEHDGNPMLRWMASHIAVKIDSSDNWRPDKAASNSRIDGLVATLTALAIALKDDGDDGGSVYNSREMYAV